MADSTYISFYLRSNTIHIFRKAVREIGCPPFIRFLIHSDGVRMIMQAYFRLEFISFRVPLAVYDKKGSMELRSKAFCQVVASHMGWDTTKSYRIPGNIYPGQNFVQFDLSRAAAISSGRGNHNLNEVLR